MKPSREKVPFFRVQGSVQTYGWGKPRNESLVYRYARPDDFLASEKDNSSDPFAELWFGAHRKGMATCPDLGNITLLDYLTQTRGQNPGCKFLLKILSIKAPLSIQIHPDKQTAEMLHKKDKANYPDDNHKPEMVIALSLFDGLVGFKPYKEIVDDFERTPELVALLGEHAFHIFKEQVKTNKPASLRALFEAYICKGEKEIDSCISSLRRRLVEAQAMDLPLTKAETWFLHFDKHHPGDIGTLGPFFLNHVQFNPVNYQDLVQINKSDQKTDPPADPKSPFSHQTAYLSPKVPHSYIQGDCVEVMANSDNVIRAGLTKKFIDRSALVENLDYTMGSPSNYLLEPKMIHKNDTFVQYFNVPLDDFGVISYHAPKNCWAQIEALPQFSLVLVFSKDASGIDHCFNASTDISKGHKTFKSGSCLFLEANTSLCLQSENSEIYAVRAF